MFKNNVYVLKGASFGGVSKDQILKKIVSKNDSNGSWHVHTALNKESEFWNRKEIIRVSKQLPTKYSFVTKEKNMTF